MANNTLYFWHVNATNAGGTSAWSTDYWRVNASNAGGTSTWSSVWSFKTAEAVTEVPTVFVANNSAKINRNKSSEGSIHSKGRIEFGTGAPGTYYGNLTAVGDISIYSKSTIKGYAEAGGEIQL